MDQFERAMLAQNVPIETINSVKTSPIWIHDFQRYSQAQIDAIIYLFPKIYHTIVPSFVSTPEQFAEAKKHYLPMDTS